MEAAIRSRLCHAELHRRLLCCRLSLLRQSGDMLRRLVLSLHKPLHHRCIHQEPADIHDTSLQLAQGQFSFFQSLQRIVLHGIALCSQVVHHHVQIVLRPYHGCGVGGAFLSSFHAVIHGGPPVRHHNSPIPPFIPQNCGIQIIVGRAPVTIYRIIGGHQAVRPAFLHCDLKASQIKLPQCPFRHRRIYLITFRLLAVAGKMLDGGMGASSPDSPHIGRRHFSGKQRVL